MLVVEHAFHKEPGKITALQTNPPKENAQVKVQIPSLPCVFLHHVYIFNVLPNVPDIIFHLTRSPTTRRLPSFPVISEAVSVPGQPRHLFAIFWWLAVRSELELPLERGEEESDAGGAQPGTDRPARGTRPDPRPQPGDPRPPVLFGTPPLDVPWIKPEGRTATFALTAWGWGPAGVTVRGCAPERRVGAAAPPVSPAAGCVRAVTFLLQRNTYKDTARAHLKPEF